MNLKVIFFCGIMSLGVASFAESIEANKLCGIEHMRTVLNGSFSIADDKIPGSLGHVEAHSSQTPLNISENVRLDEVVILTPPFNSEFQDMFNFFGFKNVTKARSLAMHAIDSNGKTKLIQMGRSGSPRILDSKVVVDFINYGQALSFAAITLYDQEKPLTVFYGTTECH